MNIIKLFTLLLIVGLISIQAASAIVDCTVSPNNCSQCTQILNNCDINGGADYTSATAATDPNNPCYAWCH